MHRMNANISRCLYSRRLHNRLFSSYWSHRSVKCSNQFQEKKNLGSKFSNSVRSMAVTLHLSFVFWLTLQSNQNTSRLKRYTVKLTTNMSDEKNVVWMPRTQQKIISWITGLNIFWSISKKCRLPGHSIMVTLLPCNNATHFEHHCSKASRIWSCSAPRIEGRGGRGFKALCDKLWS